MMHISGADRADFIVPNGENDEHGTTIDILAKGPVSYFVERMPRVGQDNHASRKYSFNSFKRNPVLLTLCLIPFVPLETRQFSNHTYSIYFRRFFARWTDEGSVDVRV